MNHCYRFFILCCCLFASSVGWAQTNNFIISRQYKKASTTNNFNEVSANSSQAASQVSYFDGLGKPIQQVMAFGAASKGDIITLTEYDNLSRPVRTFLAAPYTSNGGTSQSAADIKSKVRSYYTNGANVLATINSGASDETFSSQTTYEPSPLNRISSLKAPGANNVVSQTYGINSDGEVKLYQVTGNNLTDLSLQVSNYEPGTLTFTRTTDENSGEVTEFKDRYGRTVLKRVKDNPDSYLDTYYVYDEKGQLRVVLQPKYAKANENDLTKNAFLYAYDDHGRITDKKVPGANATHMTYKGDTDLLETATDGNGNVFYYKYDNLNRQTEMGVKPGGTETPLLYTYYDNYTFGPFQGYSNELGLTGEQFAANPDQQRLGLQTGSKVRVLKPDGTYGDWLQTVIYYDDKYRVVQTLRQLYGLGSSAYERVSYKLAFDGKPELEWTTQATNSITYKLTKTYSYDHANRLTKTDHALYENDALKKSYTHAENLYNEVGQLAAKSLHGGRHIRNYKYTPRGWLGDHQTTSGQPFSLKLTYQENGNIATQSWATSNYSGGMNLTYDQANRLTNATGTGNFSGYNESPIQYDANGNILSLTRSYANTTIDQLSYQYNGNQLTRVDDASTNESQPVKGFINGANTNDELAYDGNGNLTKDLNRSLSSVSYNVLNLPRSLTRNNLTVLYTYDATGSKLKSEAPDNLNTFYAGGFEYRADNALLRIGLEEGQLVNEAGVYSVQYYLKDHLGNVRAVMEENGSIIQETEYYAFGLPIQRTGSDKNKYLYNGKEKQPQTEWLDYGARMYDPTIGRWMVVDPLAEISNEQSPYQYVLNNPIRYIDPFGLWEETSTGYHTEDKNDIHRYLSYVNFEKEGLGNNPSFSQIKGFVKGEMSGNALGTMSNGGKLVSEVKETGYQYGYGRPIYWQADKKSVDNAWHDVQGDLTPEALDPRSLGHNLFYKSYPGGNNPKKYNGNDDYSYIPTNIIEYPAIMHDLAYDKKGVKGASGLFKSEQVIGDDWRFVAQEIALSYYPGLDPVSRFQASILGYGLGSAALTKTAIYYLKRTFKAVGKGASAIKN